MRIQDMKNYLQDQEQMPEDDEKRRKWFEMEDAILFLFASRKDMVPMYISCKNIFVYSLIVPEEKLRDDYIEDLLKWNFMVSGGYNYCVSGSEAYLCDPMEHTRSKILDGSLPVFFLRDFQGESMSLEINQRISHPLNIFWLEDKNAFCNINELGDYVKIATMENEDYILCTLKKEELDYYLFISKSVLIRVFDITRTSEYFDFPDEDRIEKLYKNQFEETFAKLTTCYNKEGKITIAYLRGIQIIRNNTSHKKMMKKAWGEEEREYESFIINDWKHREIHEWSSNPEKLGNYFVKSDLPFETSPAFFRQEVLAKYRHDPNKYTIEHRAITCRWSWSLRYDTNEEDQVVVYITDLSALPHAEQQYWKSFNEEPKAGISKRAFKTDFEGEWDIGYDPLLSLKNILQEFPEVNINGEKLPIWQIPKLSSTKDIKFLNYVMTESTKEWEDQIMALNQILIEGLNSKTIKRIANHYNCLESGLRSIKQLIKCLDVIGISKLDIEIISDPLFELTYLRSKIVAHATNEGYPKGNLKIHFKNLIEKCDKSMLKLADIVNQEFK
jgi:hypothetical protein